MRNAQCVWLISSLALATRFCCFYASVSTMKGIIVCVALQTKRCVDDEFSDVGDQGDGFSDVGDQDDVLASFFENHYGSHSSAAGLVGLVGLLWLVGLVGRPVGLVGLVGGLGSGGPNRKSPNNF